MPTTIYLFEARSIQSYLFEGGKLRDMIAASDQLDALCSDASGNNNSPFGQVLASLGLTEGTDILFPRRSGGAIYAILLGENGRDNAEKLQALWSLYVRANMPGVEVVQVIETDDNLIQTMDKARARLTVQRNRMSVQFPIPGPLVHRSPRTGKAAVSPFLHSRGEWVDEATHTKANYQRSTKNKGLVGKFAEGESLEELWPNNLELKPEFPNGDDKEKAKDSYFPFIGQDRGVALIHADGNGLGELLRVLGEKIKDYGDPKEYTNRFQEFSQGMERACIAAAQEATQILLAAREGEEGKVPARPLVLGGDDLTIIVRADLAIPFATTFCQAFEKHTKEEFTSLFEELESPEGLQKLTACAGICFIKSNQPFAQANHLAESLAKEAKKQSRNWREESQQNRGLIPSSISFHQVSSALIEDAKSVKQHEWTVSQQGAEYQLSLGCYGFEDGRNNLATLEQMASLFGEDGLNRNALREVASLIKSDWQLAQKRYIRWRDVSAKSEDEKVEKSEGKYQSKLKVFDECLNALGCDINQDGLAQLFNQQKHSPLVDLLTITALPKTPTQEAQA